MKKAIMIFATAAFAVGCTKNETVAETPETKIIKTTTQETASYKPAEKVEKEENISQKLESSENKNNKDNANEENLKTQEFSGDGTLLKLTFRHDGEGNEVVVISEHGKKDFWLYRYRQTNVYEMDGAKLTVNGKKIELTRDGKTKVFYLR